ncbi:MAG: hypothetical protein IPK02_21425 [Candidatus Accumulibacter sp.]|uniref:Integrase n=1 Tax=Candidatus Accumulibacter affinis TaxID=2954384 RepID=A0A935TCY3_9PROT|nr:hypothetical protein [Candidatus Accumulibacter affinis]
MAQIKFGKIALQGLALPPVGKRLTIYDTKVPKLQKPLGDRKLTSITRALIARALSNAEAAGKATATVRQIRALASSMLVKAIEWGYLETNPAQGVKAAGRTVSRDRFLQADELPRFFQSLAE